MATKVQKNVMSRLIKAQKRILTKKDEITLNVSTMYTKKTGTHAIIIYLHDWRDGKHNDCKDASIFSHTTQEQADKELANLSKMAGFTI